MSRSASVLVRIDRTGHTVTLFVTGEPTAFDRQEVTRMSQRARDLFPDTTVTVEHAPTPTPTTGDGQQENPHHSGDGEPERSSTAHRAPTTRRAHRALTPARPGARSPRCRPPGCSDGLCAG